MKKHWLVTAFDPFDKRPHNSSELVQTEIQKLLNERPPSNEFEFHFSVLPTIYDTVFEELLKQVSSLPPLQGILALGEGRDRLVIETLAHNLDNRPTRDNAGVAREHKPIILGAPETLSLPFPMESFQHIPTSTDAGRFVCNHLCFRAAHYFKNTNTFFGFIHVPRFMNPTQDQDKIKISAQKIWTGFENIFKTIS